MRNESILMLISIPSVLFKYCLEELMCTNISAAENNKLVILILFKFRLTNIYIYTFVLPLNFEKTLINLQHISILF